MMKRILLAVAFLIPSAVFAAGPSMPLDKANYDLTDNASLQRGAQIFMNYCLGCHNAQYQRYQRTFEDIGIPVDLGEELLQFTGDGVGSHMVSAIDKSAAAEWFGLTPPDLTLVSRVRGADWLYTFFRSFYADESRPFGVNNVIFENVGMPWMLEELQGTSRKVTETKVVNGKEQEVTVLTTDGNGRLNAEEFDQAMLDLTNFLVYVGEPVKLERQRMGLFVIGFLFVLLVLTILLKKEYWRDVK